MKKPEANEFNSYYGAYINRVEGDVFTALEQIAQSVINRLKSTSEEELHRAYAEGKWTVAELIQHMIDTERVMTYRALRIARGDRTALPGFDQDLFVKNMNVLSKTAQDFINEYQAQRAATLSFFRSLSEEETQRQGTASNNPVSVRALAYIIAGHDLHHFEVLNQRY
jgi:uncharacterized damage-inducible protein DinB